MEHSLMESSEFTRHESVLNELWRHPKPKPIGAFQYLPPTSGGLASADQISDTVSLSVPQDAVSRLVKANWLTRKGHSVKFSHEYLDPNDDLSKDHQVRNGLRSYDGIPEVDTQKRDVFFTEFHAFF